MNTDRRRLFAALAGAAAAAAATPAQANEPSTPRSGIDTAALGLRPNAAEDQTKALQRAIDAAATARAVCACRRAPIVLDRCNCRPTRPSPGRPERRASSCSGVLRSCQRRPAIISP
jgi:hypothetical protein